MTTPPRTPQPLTADQLAEMDGRAGHLYEYIDLPDDADIVVGIDVPALLAEVYRLKQAATQALAQIRQVQALDTYSANRLGLAVRILTGEEAAS